MGIGKDEAIQKSKILLSENNFLKLTCFSLFPALDVACNPVHMFASKKIKTPSYSFANFQPQLWILIFPCEELDTNIGSGLQTPTRSG